MEKQREIVVACGLPFAGQEDLAKELEGRDWRREALGNQMIKGSKSTAAQHEVIRKWKENTRRMGYDAMAAFTTPSNEAIQHFLVQNLVKTCATDIRGRLEKTGLRTVIDFNASVRSDRELLLQTLNPRGQHSITGVHMDTSPEICAMRAQYAQEQGYEFANNFDPESIRKATFEDIQESEGFGKIIRITDGDEGLVTLEKAGIDTRRHLSDWFRKIFSC